MTLACDCTHVMVGRLWHLVRLGRYPEGLGGVPTHKNMVGVAVIVACNSCSWTAIGLLCTGKRGGILEEALPWWLVLWVQVPHDRGHYQPRALCRLRGIASGEWPAMGWSFGSVRLHFYKSLGATACRWKASRWPESQGSPSAIGVLWLGDVRAVW